MASTPEEWRVRQARLQRARPAALPDESGSSRYRRADVLKSGKSATSCRESPSESEHG
jgi:hypothetical protein